MLAWLTFLSATLAAGLQGRRAAQGWLYDELNRREARRADRAGWSRYGVDTWTVRLVAPDDEAVLDVIQRPATVTVTVCDGGQPSSVQADRLRRYLEEHEYLSRNPTPAELEALEQAAQDGGRLAITHARRSRLLPAGRGRLPGDQGNMKGTS